MDGDLPIGLTDNEAQEFQSIRLRFIDHLPLRLKELKIYQNIDEQKSCLHRLSGAASSYGFNQLGDLARSLEGALEHSSLRLNSNDLVDLANAIEIVRKNVVEIEAKG